MKSKLWLIVFCLFVTCLSGGMVSAQTSVPASELADPDGQFIDIDGISIYYLQRGDPAHPTVMLLHGFGGSTFTWRDNMDALAEAGFNVIAFDRPPYGLSSKSTDIDYTTAYYAELTTKLMDAWDIDSAVLVGHSAGGGVIANVAAFYPERVLGLVFVAGAVAVEGDVFARGDASTPDASTPSPDAAVPPSAQGDAQPDDSGGGSPFASLFSGAANINPNSPLARAAVRAFLTPETFTNILQGAYYNKAVITDDVIAGYQRVLQVEGWEGAFLKLFSSPPQSTPLSLTAVQGLTMPTLIQWGQEDTWVPLAAGERLAALLPNATLITYPETGHLPMEESTQAFNADLVAWLLAAF